MSFCGSSLASAVQHQAEHKRPGQSCVGIPHLKPQFISNKPSPKLSFHLNRQSRSMHTGNTLNWQQRTFQLHFRKRTAESAYHFKSCRFITVMRAHLKVPAKNSPALLFLSRGKAADCCCFSFFFFSPAEEEQSRRIFGGNFQTCAHDGNKAAGLKVTGCLVEQKVPGMIGPPSDPPCPGQSCPSG